MSTSDFLKAIKSTIDKICIEVAADIGVTGSVSGGVIDLDDLNVVKAALQSNDSYVLWALSTLDEGPRDPLYEFHFSVGIKTADDPANYNLLSLLGKIKDRFRIEKEIEIKDYTGAVASSQKGWFFITSSSVEDHEIDTDLSVRMCSVSGKAVRVA